MKLFHTYLKKRRIDRPWRLVKAVWVLTCYLVFLCGFSLYAQESDLQDPANKTSGTVYVEIVSCPSSVAPGEMAEVEVRLQYRGDNDGPWTVTEFELRDADADSFDVITHFNNQWVITSDQFWYGATFCNLDLSKYDDGGDGIELYAWAKVNDNDPNFYSPEGNSTVRRVAVEYPPALAVDPLTLDFGTSTGSKELKIRNAGGGSLSCNISTNRSWLTVSPSGNVTLSGVWKPISVSINRAGLSDGTYQGTISLDPSTGATKTVNVSMTVTAATGTVEVQITTAPTCLSSEEQQVTVRLRYTGDNDPPWKIKELSLYDDDVLMKEESGESAYKWDPGDDLIASLSGTNYLSDTAWHEYTFKAPLYTHDDYGNGVELYAYAVIDDNDDWTGSPNGSSLVSRIEKCAPTVVSVSAADGAAAEPGTNTGTFRISRAGNTDSGLSVYFTMGGTATNGSDYVSLSSPRTIPAGSTFVDVPLTPIDDSAYEGNETAVLTLSSNSAYGVGTPSSATVTIQDNDSPAKPVVTVTAPDADASEPGTNKGIFRISRTGSTSSSLSVSFTLGGTAMNGSDYITLSTPKTIPAGSAYMDLMLTPRSDSVSEGDETVILSLAGNTAYDVGSPGSATVKIHDDTGCPLTGDADGNGSVTPGDAQAVFDDYLGLSQVPRVECADVCPNYPAGDGNITPGDAQAIFNMYLGLDQPCD